MAFELSQLEEQIVAALKGERKDVKKVRYSLRSFQRRMEDEELLNTLCYY